MSICVAPGSLHEDGEHVYSWLQTDVDAPCTAYELNCLVDAPFFNVEALKTLMNAGVVQGAKPMTYQVGHNKTFTSPPPSGEPAPASTSNHAAANATAKTNLMLNRSVNVVCDDRTISLAGAQTLATYRSGSRRYWLNDMLCADAAWCDTLGEVLDKAMDLNASLDRHGIVPMELNQVIEVVGRVWADVQSGKIVKRFRQKARAYIDRHEFFHIRSTIAKNDVSGDVLSFLMLLRLAHDARLANGETFALSVHSMVEHCSMPVGSDGGWGHERYKTTIKALIALGYVVKISDFSTSTRGRVAAQYALARPEIIDTDGEIMAALVPIRATKAALEITYEL